MHREHYTNLTKITKAIENRCLVWSEVKNNPLQTTQPANLKTHEECKSSSRIIAAFFVNKVHNIKEKIYMALKGSYLDPLPSRLLQLFVCRHVETQPGSSPKSPEHFGTRRRSPAKVRSHHTNTQGVTAAIGEIKNIFQGGDYCHHGSINWTTKLPGTTHRAPRPKS